MNGGFEVQVDLAVRESMSLLKVPGCAFALIEGGQVTARHVYGMADASSGAPVTPATRFSLQSISKSIAAWAVMALTESGAIDLDAPISRYVTTWSLPPSDIYDLDLVTPRRLLSHHAGVTEAGFLGVEPQLTGYTLLDALNCTLPPPNAEQARHWAYWNLPEPEPVSVTAPPGEGWRYSNAGFALLQLMIEEVYGQTFQDYVATKVLRPLGMANSGFGRDPHEPYASPHGRDGGINTDYIWPCDAAAGVYATIDDLAVFACAGMRGPNGEAPGRGVLGPASLAAMYSSYGAADRSSGVPFEAGLGHVLLRGEGPMNVFHSGGTIGWRSIFSIFPETGDGFCMLMNGEAGNDLWIPIVRTWREGIHGRNGDTESSVL